MVKLGCVNCGASLEIRPDLDTFACGYCGSQQRVERKGGVVELRRVETAIKAVQRGTDRTAAELAMPRLKKELEEADRELAAELKAAEGRRASVIRGRTKLTWIAFAICFIGGQIVLAAVAGKSDDTGVLPGLLALAWLVSCFVVPVFVYKKTRLPPDQTAAITARHYPRIQQLRARLDANRAILDE